MFSDTKQAQSNLGRLVRKSSVVFLVSVWVLGLCSAGLIFWMLVEKTRSDVTAVVSVVEQYSLRNIDLSRVVANEFAHYLDQHGGADSLAHDRNTHEELLRLQRMLPLGSGIIFVDPEGFVVNSSESYPTPLVWVGDRRWFAAHVQDGFAAYVGPAIHSRVIDKVVYTYTQAYRDASGKLLGITNLGILSDTLITNPRAHLSVALVQHEGRIVAAQPFSPDALGKILPDPGRFAALKGGGFDRFWGTPSIVATRDIADHKLYAVAAIPLLTVLGPALWGFAIGLITLAALTAVLVFLSRSVERKSRALETALADNSVLYREVHHRVKNNLQIIDSLSRLQAGKLPPRSRAVMEQMGGRVRAIALVHDHVYHAANVSRIRLDLLLAKLHASIVGQKDSTEPSIESVQAEPIEVPLDQAVPFALLASEALSNAHEAGRDGAVSGASVRLFRKDGLNTLVIASVPGPETAPGAAAMSSRVMQALASQLGGSCVVQPGSTSGETEFVLSWSA